MVLLQLHPFAFIVTPDVGQTPRAVHLASLPQVALSCIRLATLEQRQVEPILALCEPGKTT